GPAGAPPGEDGRPADAAAGDAVLRQGAGAVRGLRGDVALALQRRGQALRPLLGAGDLPAGAAAFARQRVEKGADGPGALRGGAGPAGGAVRPAAGRGVPAAATGPGGGDDRVSGREEGGGGGAAGDAAGRARR